MLARKRLMRGVGLLGGNLYVMDIQDIRSIKPVTQDEYQLYQNTYELSIMPTFEFIAHVGLDKYEAASQEMEGKELYITQMQMEAVVNIINFAKQHNLTPNQLEHLVMSQTDADDLIQLTFKNIATAVSKDIKQFGLDTVEKNVHYYERQFMLTTKAKLEASEVVVENIKQHGTSQAETILSSYKSELIHALASPDLLSRLKASKDLVKVGDICIAPLVASVEFACSEQDPIRLNFSIATLVALGPAIIPNILDLMTTESSVLRWTAMVTLRNLGPTAIQPILEATDKIEGHIFPVAVFEKMGFAAIKPLVTNGASLH